MSMTESPLEIEVIDPLPQATAWGAKAQAMSRAETAAPSIDPIVDAISDGFEAIAELVGRVARVLSRRVEQFEADGNPRRHSRVRHHVFAPFGDVVARLPAEGSSWASHGARIEIVSAFRPHRDGGQVADARLCLRGSWPALPLRISADPWWRERTLVTVTLRTRRRWRYPRRYYRGVHHSLRAMTGEWAIHE